MVALKTSVLSHIRIERVSLPLLSLTLRRGFKVKSSFNYFELFFLAEAVRITGFVLWLIVNNGELNGI